MKIGNTYKLVIESIIKEAVDYIGYSDDYNEDLEDRGIDEYEAADEALRIAKEGGINILSDKHLVGLLIDNTTICGALWVSNNSNEFSFDIAIDRRYQGRQLSYILIDAALEEYAMQNEIYSDMYNGSNLPLNIDVVNPILARTLINKYKFHIKDKVGPNRVILTR